MDDEPPHSDKKRRKRSHSDDNNGNFSSKKQPRQGVSLTSLPIELLYSIHLYAKNPNFTLINQRFHTTFETCPTSVKAKYLLARWYEAYCYGFKPTLDKAKRGGMIRTKAASSSQKRAKISIPATPDGDLLEGGSLPELLWNSRFLPVLPSKDFPYPLTNSFQRSADHFILDFCLQYPLCTSEVLYAVEDLVLSKPEFGNIILATGLWKDEQGQLCTYQSFYEDGKEHEEYVKPSHLIVNHLPKRIFHKLETRSETTEEAGIQKGDTKMLDEGLIRYLNIFGPGAVPKTTSLLLFLSIISLHIPTSPSFMSATVPINGYEGLPLAKSAFAQSGFMVQILLSLGAEPSRKEGLALYVAIRNGWSEGFKMMIERDEGKIAQWEYAISAIRSYFRKREERRRKGLSLDLVSSGDDDNANKMPDFTIKKKRRLLDRAQPDSRMLKEAVKHDQWTIANYIRSRGVIPDLRTIKLIELKQNEKQSGL